MSGRKKPENSLNEGSSSLSTKNLNKVPDGRQNNMVERFFQSPASDGPYFARAQMDERSAHASKLASQITATEEVMKKKKR